MRYTKIMAAVVEQKLFTEEQAGIYCGYPAVFDYFKSSGRCKRADRSKQFKMPLVSQG
jgi:hypothetical protein